MTKIQRLAIALALLLTPALARAEGMALGIQGGIGEYGNDNQPYFALGLRLPLGDQEDYGVRGFWEPEVSYTDGDSGRDTSFGINLVGVLSQGTVASYVGGGLAVHDLTYESTFIGDDGTKIGANFHAGVDLKVSDSMTLFGQGRIDFVEGQRQDNVLGRATIGVRIKF